MEIDAFLFFFYLAQIENVSLILGLKALKKTEDLPASIPPAVLFLLKQFLAIAAAHSSTHAVVFHTKLKIHVTNYYACFLLTFSPVAFLTQASPWFLKIYSVLNTFVLIYYVLPWKKTLVGADDFFHKASLGIALLPLLFLLPSSEKFRFPLVSTMSASNFLVTFPPGYTTVESDQFRLHIITTYMLLTIAGLSPALALLSPLLTVVTVDERWLPSEENGTFSELKRIVRKYGGVIKFSVGMAGTILIQCFFRLATLDHVVANQAVFFCTCDFGLLNYLLSNVIVGCTVNQFGVGKTTWLVYAAALLLYVLRMKCWNK